MSNQNFLYAPLTHGRVYWVPGRSHSRHQLSVLSLIRIAPSLPVRYLTNAPRHRGEQLRPHVWPCPRALGNADPTGCRFSKVWDALIEIHIPALHAAHQLLVFGNRGRGTRV